MILIATGSELQIAVEAREVLEADGVPTRVVSMPCVEWFDAQDEAYRDVGAAAGGQGPGRASRPASRMPWHRFVGDAGENVSIEHFGASADYQTLFREFGFTTENVVAAARRSLRQQSEPERGARA